MTCLTHFSGAVAAALVTTALTGVAYADGNWPTEPSTLIVIAGAGGGSDYTMRLLARELEASADAPISVVNQAQGAGVVGMTTYVNAAPDGKTVGQMSPFAQYRMMGQADFTSASFTPIALINMDPASVSVATDSALTSLEDIVAKLKEDPASLRISCGGGCNASWDIPFVAMLLDQGVDVAKLNLIPAQGSAAGLQELTSGGMDIVLCSLPETDALRDAGLVKNLAVFSADRLDRYPDVPTVEEATGVAATGGTWRGIAGPAGMDQALVASIEASIKQAYDSERYQTGMQERGFGAVWMDATELGAFMQEHETQTERVIKALNP